LVAGRPVVASWAGALPEVLRHDRDALIVTPDRPDELAAAVVRLASEPALVERLVSQGRRRVLERFDQRRGGEAFAEVVRSVVTLRE
jgi:glycosyltransferase involved in cell wall biosynthesis